ncbi:MAG: hypothetical protein BIFFINMI_02820 [Phycisphaerae bacterium]|nr:hypothetical protein [Phycisphaerae bacterium]
MRTCEACGRDFRGSPRPGACPYCGFNTTSGIMPRICRIRPPRRLTPEERIEAKLQALEREDRADRQEYQREHSDDN